MSLSFGRRWSCGIVAAALVLSARTEASAQADVLVSRTSGIKLKLIPKGEFMMGSLKEQDPDADDDEQPRHRVRISPYYLGVTEVTQGQYRAVTGQNPSEFKGIDDRPVETVSWFDAASFCNALSRAEGLPEYYRVKGEEVEVVSRDGSGYRLPTEAEWEYACRAGGVTRFSFGDDQGSLGDFAWYGDNSGNESHPVAGKRPNQFGLYDMHGNVWEWCGDVYASDYYGKSPVDDPAASDPRVRIRVGRGGCWYGVPRFARSADRDWFAPVIRYDLLGFRVARGRRSLTLSGACGRSRDAGDKPRTLADKIYDPGSAVVVKNDPGRAVVVKSANMRMNLIPAGEFMMGSSKEQDADAEGDEQPRHRVRISSFYLGATEVTRGQFRKIVELSHYKTEAERDGKGGWGWNKQTGKFGQAPTYSWRSTGFDQTDEHPVVNVSWNDAVAFCNALSRAEGVVEYYRLSDGTALGGLGYRLPTEAEWEYACRAGTTTRYVGGDDPETLAGFGNVADATAKERFPSWTLVIRSRDGFVFTAPVGRFRANGFGLYDVHGNVWEWCGDWYASDYYGKSPVDDPLGPAASGARVRVNHGGGWGSNPRYARSALRVRLAPDNRNFFLGFRVARGRSDAK